MQNNNKDEASRQEAHHQIDFGYQMVDEDKKADQVREVFDSVAPKYDLLNDVLSLGLHRVWKSRCINATETKQGQKVLDIASGTCDLAIALARRAGAGNVVATDINHEMLAIGAQRLLQAGFPCPVVEADAEMLPFADNTFDVVTVSFGIRNMTHKDRALREMLRACCVRAAGSSCWSSPSASPGSSRSTTSIPSASCPGRAASSPATASPTAILRSPFACTPTSRLLQA